MGELEDIPRLSSLEGNLNHAHFFLQLCGIIKLLANCLGTVDWCIWWFSFFLVPNPSQEASFGSERMFEHNQEHINVAKRRSNEQ